MGEVATGDGRLSRPPSDLARMLNEQLALQVDYFDDPRELRGEERIEFIRWNVLALLDEVHEVLAECGWKPWSGSRHVDEGRAVNELIDAFHFFMNLLWAMSGEHDPETLADRFVQEYLAKVAVNRERQEAGYEARRAAEKTHVKDLIRHRSVVSFWDREISIADLATAAAHEPPSYQLHEVRRDGGTVYVDATYTARGANAAQIRRLAASLAERCGRPVGEHAVSLVETKETVVLEAAS